MSDKTARDSQITGRNIPDFCRPEYVNELLEKEALFNKILSWPTNSYDTRSKMPEYLKDFAESRTVNKTVNL